MCYGLGKRAPLESSAGPVHYKDSVIFFHFIVFLFVCASFLTVSPFIFSLWYSPHFMCHSFAFLASRLCLDQDVECVS